MESEMKNDSSVIEKHTSDIGSATNDIKERANKKMKTEVGVVQQIHANSLDQVSKDLPRRKLSELPSKIPVACIKRRDNSTPPSLPSSDRSTPYHAPLQREASLPPGLLSLKSSRPKIAPKPKLRSTKSVLLVGTIEQVDSGMDSGRSTPSKISKIPKPNNGLKKWDSTSRLEVPRKSVHQRQGIPQMVRSSSSSSLSGRMVRSSSLSSFKSQVDLNLTKYGSRSKLSMDKSNTTKDTAPDYQVLFNNLNSEHSKLARAATEAAREAEIGKRGLELQLREMIDKLEVKEAELKDVKDNAELLEFRLLELEDSAEPKKKKDKGVLLPDTDSGCPSVASVEDIRDIQTDFRNEKIGETKIKLHDLMDQITEPGGKSLLLQTVALFETLLTKIQSMTREQEKLTDDNAALLEDLQYRKDVEVHLLDTQSKLQAVNEELQETLQKLFTSELKLSEAALAREKLEETAKQINARQLQIESDLRVEIESYQLKLVSMSEGNQEESKMYQDSLEKVIYQERCIAGLEAQLTDIQRSHDILKASHQISNTGSSSGLGSDLSSEDSDSDFHTKEKDSEEESGDEDDTEFIRKEQLSESGIFEQDPSILEAFTEKASQTENTMIDQIHDDENPNGGKIKSDENNNDQLEELRSLSDKLRDMEAKWEILYIEHQEVVEERCELEEAENDSRLQAQKLEIQYNGALERSQIIKEELIMERQASEELKMQLEDMLNRDERSQDELEHLQSLLHEQEEHVHDIQQREDWALEQLHLLQLGISIQGWWNTWSHLLNEEKKNESEKADEDIQQILQSHMETVSALKADFEGREDILSTQLQDLQCEYDSCLLQMGELLGMHDDGWSDVIERVRELVQSELRLKKQVSDLEKKEAAYGKTIKEADTIMARVEMSYQEQIHELETEKQILKENVRRLEEGTKSLKDKKDEMKTISNLIEKLKEVEQSEIALKEKVKALESFSEEMKSKVVERELINAKIKHELKDQEELVQKICDTENHNQELSREVERLREVDEQLIELRGTEFLLRERLDELEINQLKLDEQKLGEDFPTQIIPTERELVGTVKSLKLQVEDLKSEVDTQSAKLEAAEAACRTEVSCSGQSFARYRSMRDHTGRFMLMVKIR